MCKDGADACWHALVLDDQFFSGLQEIDQKLAQQVAEAGCPWCGSPLDRSDYDRKPRVDVFITATVEPPRRRISFCCRREGCRRRATPPSVIFLGRRVYLGAVVIVASALALILQQAAATLSAAARRPATVVPARTLARWGGWWEHGLTATSLFAVLSGLLASPIDGSRLPCSLLERLAGGAVEQVTALLKLLTPLTTGSVADGARFLRGAGLG